MNGGKGPLESANSLILQELPATVPNLSVLSLTVSSSSKPFHNRYH